MRREYYALLGFIPRMTLPRIIGAEGVGLYQLGYPLLIAVLTIITGGIPIAVAKLVAEAEAEQDKEVRSCSEEQRSPSCLP